MRSYFAFVALALPSLAIADANNYVPVPGHEDTLEIQQPKGMTTTHQPNLANRTHYADSTFTLSFSVRQAANAQSFSRFAQAKSSAGQKISVLEQSKGESKEVHVFRQDMLDQGKVVVSMFHFGVLHTFGEQRVSCIGLATEKTLASGVAACKSLRKKS